MDKSKQGVKDKYKLPIQFIFIISSVCVFV
jgi:hypothetical protein